MTQSDGNTRFFRGVRTGLTVTTILLPLVFAAMLFTLVYIWCSYGNPRPDNWFRLELMSKIIENTLLPVIGIWLLACLARWFAGRKRAWLLAVPVVLVPVLLALSVVVVVQDYKLYMKGMDRVRDCEAVIIMC